MWRDIKGFSDLMSSVMVHVLSVYQINFNIWAIKFSCSWDREHAFGTMLLETAWLKSTETHFLICIARKDQRALNTKR